MAWYWHKTQIYQGSTTESPEIDTHINGLDFQQRHQDNKAPKPLSGFVKMKDLLTNGAEIDKH